MTELEQLMRTLLLQSRARVVRDRKDFGDDAESYGASVRRVGKEPNWDLNNDFGYYVGIDGGKYVVAMYGKYNSDGTGEVTHYECFDTLAEMHAVWELDVW